MIGARRSLGSLIALLIVLGAALAPQAASAAPSKFVQELCDSALPGGGVPEWSFTANPGVAFSPFVSCAVPGGSMGISQGQTSATFSYMEIAVAPTPGGFIESETIAGISQGMSAGNHLSHIKVEGWPFLNSGETRQSFFLRSRLDTGFVPSNSGSFNIVMSCDGNMSPCSGGSLSARDIAVTQVDVTPPVVKNLAGSLLSGEILRGHHDLSAEALDLGGGVSKVELLVNGQPAAGPVAGACNLASVKNLSYEGVVAVTPSPCPSALKGNWLLDTASPPFQNGANTVQVCASDFSTLTDPNRTCSAPQQVEVDNSCTESAVAGGQSISAQFTRTHKETATLPAGSAADVVGELTDAAGDAISGATICVQAQVQGSATGLQPVATTTTDAHGHFVYKVDPGPDRRLLLGYRHDTFQVARSVRYLAHAKVKFKITPGRLHNGGEIKMWGKLPGPRAAERVVVLQAGGLHSPKWYPFGEATTNRNGVFHAHYRFHDTPETTIYKIRAVAPRQHGWPWEAGHSKPILVEVRG
ncbi:MAG: carboxypeptidase-like regulatory domain-containing protein [Solirubrobacterales bacterium]